MHKCFRFLKMSKLVPYYRVALMAAILTPYQYHCASPYMHFMSQNDGLHLKVKFPNLFVLDKSQTEHLLSVIRNVKTSTKDYRQFSDRLIRLLLEKAIQEHRKKVTPKLSSQAVFEASEIAFEMDQFCVITILRSGSAFLPEAFKVLPGATVGSLLILKNEETQNLYSHYTKLPVGLEDKQIVVVDAMITSGARMITALKEIVQHGGKQENITVVNIISCDKGISKVLTAYPKIKLITSTVDSVLKTQVLIPGIGDFGDRYFGTI